MSCTSFTTFSLLRCPQPEMTEYLYSCCRAGWQLQPLPCSVATCTWFVVAGCASVSCATGKAELREADFASARCNLVTCGGHITIFLELVVLYSSVSTDAIAVGTDVCSEDHDCFNLKGVVWTSVFHFNMSHLLSNFKTKRRPRKKFLRAV